MDGSCGPTHVANHVKSNAPSLAILPTLLHWPFTEHASSCSATGACAIGCTFPRLLFSDGVLRVTTCLAGQVRLIKILVSKNIDRKRGKIYFLMPQPFPGNVPFNQSTGINGVSGLPVISAYGPFTGSRSRWSRHCEIFALDYVATRRPPLNS